MYYLQYFVAVGLVHLHVHFVSFWGSKLYRKSYPKPLQKGSQMTFEILARFVLQNSQLHVDLGTQHTPDRLSHFWGGSLLLDQLGPCPDSSGWYKPWCSSKERLKPSINALKVTPECDSGPQLGSMLGWVATIFRTPDWFRILELACTPIWSSIVCFAVCFCHSFIPAYPFFLSILLAFLPAALHPCCLSGFPSTHVKQGVGGMGVSR